MHVLFAADDDDEDRDLEHLHHLAVCRLETGPGDEDPFSSHSRSLRPNLGQFPTMFALVVFLSITSAFGFSFGQSRVGVNVRGDVTALKVCLSHIQLYIQSPLRIIVNIITSSIFNEFLYPGRC
jgi:hypothetical protein